jgi:hypothetical protein
MPLKNSANCFILILVLVLAIGLSDAISKDAISVEYGGIYSHWIGNVQCSYQFLYGSRYGGCINPDDCIGCVDLGCCSAGGEHHGACYSNGTSLIAPDHTFVCGMCKCTTAPGYCVDYDCLANKDSSGQSGQTGHGEWEGIGYLELTPCSSNPDTTADSSRLYLPMYGDTLCYKVTVSRPMRVDVLFNTSTYEGMAMNAPVPAGEDTLDDVLLLADASWAKDSSWFEGDRGYTRLHRGMDKGEVAYLNLRLLDYAAEAELFAAQSGFLRLKDYGGHVVVPYIADTTHSRHFNFRSVADADSDGLTQWEEYRGFMVPLPDTVVHYRFTDSLVSSVDGRDNHFTIFVDNKGGMPGWCKKYVARMIGVDSLVTYRAESPWVREGRFMDFMARKYNDTTDSHWGRNKLVEIQQTSND